ncbi:hypothetical protein VTH82DRAFT_3552 [Thermothelomyces myriococcoides]
MPYPFVLPTTSSFSFSSSFASESHPSLPLQASTHRGVVRDALKKYKRLPPASQASSLSTVTSTLQTYLPYLLALDAGLSPKGSHSADKPSVTLTATPQIEWRPTLSGSSLPGREPPRVKIHSLEHEIMFALSTLANTYTLQSRAALQPLYLTNTAPVGTTQRQTAITTATRYLLDAASIYDYLCSRLHLSPDEQRPPCPDIAPSTLDAMRSLALAEATLLAVLKDDPYPAIVAQARNPHDTEWMYKSPDVPKVRAHLFARLCLAASEHASQAAAGLASSSSSSSSSPLSGSGLGSAGKMLTQPIPPVGSLLAQMPSGREIHTIKPFQPPALDSDVLEAMRALPDGSDEVGNYPSSDEETAVNSIPGTFPGASGPSRSGTPGYF